MKKKGFTLIELLAVIIILAIIALIATPIVLDIIEDTRRSAFERSVDGYYKAAEFVYNEMFLNGDTQDIHLTFKDGVQTSNNDSYKIGVSGEKIKNGIIYIFEDGQITVDVQGDKYCATKINGSFEFNDCTGVATEIPEECFYIQNEPLANIDYYDDFDYTEDWHNENYNILYYNDGQEGCPTKVNTLIIPEEIAGQKVEGIFSYGGTFPVEAQTVILPSSMKIIGAASFIGMYSIKSISLPDNLMFIGSEALAGNLLTSVKIPDGTKGIGYNAFYDNQLTSLNIPSSVTKIGVSAFNLNKLPDNQAFIYKRNSDGTDDTTILVGYGGAKKENVMIPNGVSIIDDQAFMFEGLLSVVIPNSVISIGSQAFQNNQLMNIIIPSSVTSIGAQAFTENKLTSIEIPSSITKIEEGTFLNNQLTNVIIPDSVTSIGYRAFQNNKLTNVTISNSITSIEKDAFKSNAFPNASAITIEGDTTRFDSNWTSIGFPAK